jgi:Ser/Thr protein kinase RdoA (MazF antagonist)
MADRLEGAVPLVGGRMSAGIVRLGDTVRRPVSRSSAFMASLLALFEQHGFAGAPKYLGQEEGADILSFIPGEVPARFQPWADDQVRAAAKLLRQMHDATCGSDLAGRFDVVCHHDPGPNNMVFQDGLPVAFIDFAEAAPGSRLEDVGYMAWTWSISSKQAVPLREQAAQVRLIADAYGLEVAERHALVDCVLERQSRNVRFWAEFLARPAIAPAAPELLISRIEWSRREHAFVNQHRDVFDQALA